MNNTQKNNIISVSSFTKSYKSRNVFEDVNITMPSGINGIIGPNGYGKTTFLETCMGIRSDYSGNIKILNNCIKNVRKYIGFVPDKISFPKNIFVKDYINIIAGLYNVNVPEELLDISNIKSVLNSRIGVLSAGYLKRLSFFIAIMHKPDLVLADELFANVDFNTVNIMKTLIKKLSLNGTSFIISSHDISQLSEIADHMFIIKNKKIKSVIKSGLHAPILEITTDSPENLFSYIKEKFTCEIDGNSVLMEYNNIKSVMEILSKFNGNIIKLRTIDKGEVLANEAIKAFNADGN